MKDYNEDYFYIDRTGDRYPLLKYNEFYDGNHTEIYARTPLDTTKERLIRFAPPIPRNPKLGDLHYLAQNAPVISERLKNVLESLNLKNMQFLPAVIYDKWSEEHKNFFIIHAYNMIRCMDKEKSKWRPSPWNSENAIGIEKLVLDNEVLDQIPLEERLVFALSELSAHVLYHQSIVEKILEINPTGLTVYRLSKWDPSLPFIENYVNNSLGEDNDN